MQSENISTCLDKIISLSVFESVFEELKATDPETGANIVNSIHKLLNQIHNDIQQARNNPDRLALALYRESVELKAHASVYLRYSEMMANYEAKLLRFSTIALNAFFDLVFDGLSEYFSLKREIIFKEIEESFTWYTGLKDTGKKSVGTLLNLGAKGLRKGFEEAYKLTGGQVVENGVEDKIILDDSTLIEEVFRKHLSPETLRKDIGAIIENSTKKLEEAWKKEIKDLALDMDDLKAFSQQKALEMEHHFSFELGYAEQTFTIGMGAAAAATLGFAAGWHTIAYSLIEIFPWAAVFTVLATLATAILTKQRSIDKKKNQVRETIENLYRMFSSTIDMQPVPELENKTLRQALSDKQLKLVNELLQKWNQLIAGKLDINHYRKINAATTQHLLLIQDCLEALKVIPLNQQKIS